MAVQEGGLKTPFSGVQAGQTLQASVIGINATGCGKGNRIRYVSELTTRPSALDAARRGELPAPAATIPDLAPGQRIVGAVHSVAKDHLFVALSGSLRGYVHALNCAPAVAAGATLRKLYRVGQLVRCTVIALDSDSQRVDLSLLPHGFARIAPRADATPEDGQLVMAEVKSVAGACVVCTLANGVHAAAALTCLHDTFVPNALEGVRPGAVVVVKVLAGGKDGKGRIALSLQQRDGGKHAGVPLRCLLAAHCTGWQGGCTSTALFCGCCGLRVHIPKTAVHAVRHRHTRSPTSCQRHWQIAQASKHTWQPL